MGILDEDVAKVRDATDLVALASEHLALKRVGGRFVGLCPFHAEKTPSFSINPEIGRWYCFGCQANGDAISFVREVEHLDFVEAVERLAARTGITLRYDSQAVTKDRSRRDRLVAAVTAAVDFYHRLLLDAPEGGAARRYLRSRGFDGDHARRFALGWAPDAWDRLSVHLQREKFSRDDVVAAGLAFVNKANKLQDQFRARLLFPIYDGRGDAVGFGGRALTGDGPKYKNSPETPIYQKSRLLYGLNWAKGEIVARGEVIICEGYTDVMAFTLAGAPTAVATCGTALADEHFGILKNLARKVVLAYDGDAAGQGAAEKWYGWEQKFEIQLEVADLPPGRDPAEVWHDDPAALLGAIERAEPFLRFRLDRLLAAADLSSLEGRARAGERGAAIIAEHPSDLVRDQYVMWIAGNLDIAADRLRDTVNRQHGRPREDSRAREPRRHAIVDDSVARDRAAPPRVDRREADLLRWAIHEPELVVDWLEPYLFSDSIVRAAFEAVAGSGTIHDAIDGSDGAARDLLKRLSVEATVPDDQPETLRFRLMVDAVVPAAQKIQHAFARIDDPRSNEVGLLLDALDQSRNAGDWDAVLHNANQLLGWVAVGLRGVNAK